MTSIDHIVGPRNRLTPALLHGNESTLMERLDQFCGAREFMEIFTELQRIIEQKTDFNIGYIISRPECAFGINLPGFVDTSIFDSHPGNPAFTINLQDTGLELFAIMRDCRAKSARLNLGLILKPGSSSTPEKELWRLSHALAEENEMPSQEVNVNAEAFLRKLIHQVRNPLATILISASQMAMKADDLFNDDDRMLVDFINSESEKIEYYLSKYAEYARVEKPDFREIDVSGLFSIVKEACGHDNLPGEKLTWTISAGIAGLKVMIDPDQFSCALQEVINNAHEAAGQKEEKISVSLRKNENLFQIIICDNGSGIRPEILRKVKEPFFSTKDGGSGLGLAIADKIVTAHGGKISIDSLPDKGTRITISLPCK